MLSPALRWALLGLMFSALSNAVFEGGWVPGVLIAMLPTWVIAFRSTFGTVSDFLSPVAGYVVERFGAFNSLAFTEGFEGVLCLMVALVPNSWPGWKWLLLTLACLLLVTGQVIDVASEVFEVDAANGDDAMLISYSGVASIVSSLFGTLVGNTLGAALTGISLPIMLLVSALASLACAATRFATRHGISENMAIRTMAVGTGAASPPSQGTADLPSSVTSTGFAPARETGLELETSPIPLSRQIGLLASSGMTAFIASVWVSYSILALGRQYGRASMSTAYAFLGAGSVVGSFIFAGISPHLSMRNTAVTGIAFTVIGLLTQLIPTLPLILVGMLLAQLGHSMTVQPVILSRQLIFTGHGLARFTGYSRLAFAISAAAGSWIGWLASSSRQLLILIALAGSLAFLATTGSLVNKKPAASSTRS